MNNASALASFLEWWKSVPESRRPGKDGHFSMTSSNVELYVLDLREKWFRCGRGILNICQPHREQLEREALSAAQDLRAWLDQVETALVPKTAGAEKQSLRDWLKEWRAKLDEVSKDPLGNAPGLTLGASSDSKLLQAFRWWGDQAGFSVGPGGPLGNAPDVVGRATEAVPFPESVNELQHAVATSPWTAAHILNWLLSNKGILRPSKKSPTFEGPPAVPSARLWLDQLHPVFDDWRVSKFENRSPAQRSPEYVAGRLLHVDDLGVSSRASSVFSQQYGPVVPSAYIVPVGNASLDLKPHYAGATDFLKAPSGQCCVFEFLISRIATLLSNEADFEGELAPLPRLAIVSAKRKGAFEIEVGRSRERRKVSRGVVRVLCALNKDGKAGEKVLASVVADLRRVMPEIGVHLDASSKKGNYYEVTCRMLQGQVLWKATVPPPK